jgi:hypothetical protein
MVGRIQNYKNWSPEMVPNPRRTSLGLEYFVQEGDELWRSSDQALAELAVRELVALGLVDGAEVIGHAVVRAPKAYPVYDGEYQTSLETVRSHLAGIAGLHLVGRNGQHRYNNQDHSMVTGILAARNVAGADHDLWAANADPSYLEEIRAPVGAVADRAIPRPSRDREFGEVLSSLFAHYDPLALGTAVGLVAGLTVFLATAVLLLRGGAPLGPTLSLLGHYLLGFQVSWGGAFLGFFETGVGGFAFGYALARLINLVVDVVADSVIRECQLQGLLEPPGSVDT